MSRSSVNSEKKKGLDAKKDVSAEDEWAHLAGDQSVETKIEKKIEATDAMDVQDRSVTFGNEGEVTLRTPYEMVKAEARNAMDAAGNTGQYIRFVNKHIDKQKREIEKIKKIKEKFDHEIDLLQSNRSKIDGLNKKLLPQQNVKTITESLHQLLLEKGITKSKLYNLKNEIGSIENELKQQEKQIEDVSEDLKKKKILSRDEVNEQKIQDELQTLMKRYGITNTSQLKKLMK